MKLTIAHLAGASAALFLMPLIGSAQESGFNSEVIDTVTIIGKRSNVADIPGSAHVVDA